MATKIKIDRAPQAEPLTLKVKRLSVDAKLPTYGTAGAACFDLYASADIVVAAGRPGTCSTGIAVEVPEGYVMLVYSRSGHGFKSGVRLANSVGVVDSDYRGEVFARLQNDGKDIFIVRAGDRVAQAMLLPVPRVALEWADELGDTARGTNGMGSTGA